MRSFFKVQGRANCKNISPIQGRVASHRAILRIAIQNEIILQLPTQPKGFANWGEKELITSGVEPLTIGENASWRGGRMLANLK